MTDSRRRSLKRDNSDDAASRNPRDRNMGMCVSSEFYQPCPMFFTREMAPLNIIGHYRGASIFLISNGPSFADLDHNLLRQPGVVTFGLNNGPATFRPNFWTCVDDPSRFLKSIWQDPLITKFVPQAAFEKRIFDNDKWEASNLKVGECPNVIGYRRNEKFVADRFLFEDTINWGNHKDFGGGRTVLLPAMRICFLLGFRTVYLLGVDLNMSTTLTYHFDEQRDNGAVKGNMNTYKRMKEEYFPQLKPFFDAEDFKVYNCNEHSELKCFPYMSYEEAIFRSTSGVGNVRSERTWGMYCKPQDKLKWKTEMPDEQKENIIAQKKTGKVESVGQLLSGKNNNIVSESHKAKVEQIIDGDGPPLPPPSSPAKIVDQNNEIPESLIQKAREIFETSNNEEERKKAFQLLKQASRSAQHPDKMPEAISNDKIRVIRVENTENITHNKETQDKIQQAIDAKKSVKEALDFRNKEDNIKIQYDRPEDTIIFE